ncbi:MAG: OmpA family protein [Taibaiella sp.]|nr:OmpA family protein [Taibaiella sp.]
MKRSLLLGLALLIVIVANAQRYLGIATSDWSATNSVYLNPANIADSRTKFSIDLFSVNVGVDNDLGTINTSNFASKFYKGDSVNINDIFKYSNKGAFNMIAPYAEVRGPGFMWNIDHKNSIALTTRIRGINQFTNVSQDLYRTILDPSYAKGANGDYTLNSGKFNWTAATWSEIGVTYARVLVDNGRNMLKAGVTVRYLGGIGYVSMQGNNLDGHYYKANDSLQLTNTDLHFASNIISTQNQLSNGISNADLLSRFFGSNGGKGVGGDIGLVYEFRPDYNNYYYDMDGQTHITDYSKNRYKLRFAASVTDIGFINYNTNNRTGSISGTGSIKGADLGNNISNYSEFKTYAQTRGFTVDSNSSSTKVHLPAALLLSADYRIGGNFYVNATYINNLVDRYQVGNAYYNQITVTPRYDTRVFSVGVPISYSMLANDLKVGLGARIAGFFIGSDDMLALFSNNQYGYNIYFGAYIPVNYKKPRDRDHDNVSDKRDKCPTVQGVWAYKGCPDPDRDHDGIPDSLDKCPDVPGSPTAHGCPDKDLDSVADAQDRCPDVAGPVALQGCPDRDHDGIADIDDACPDQAGPAKFHGCPDRDGDGVPDNEDKCPDNPGPIANQGCPDTDNDGIPDNIDRCPTVPGTVANHGCPEISIEVKKRLAFAATAIQFQTGKAIIKKTSYPLLNEIVQILNNYPDYIMTIDGHTDNVGKPDKNLVLSRDRAASVKDYFVSKGVATGRLITNGHGDTEPVASNKTAAGKAKNRRVAMDLKLKE